MRGEERCQGNQVVWDTLWDCGDPRGGWGIPSRSWGEEFINTIFTRNIVNDSFEFSWNIFLRQIFDNAVQLNCNPEPMLSYFDEIAFSK